MKSRVVSMESKVVMETDFKEKYDSVLRDKLQELRDEFEEEAENIKLDVENSYKQKVCSISNVAINCKDLMILLIIICSNNCVLLSSLFL